ncbi:MAG: oxidoreductase [Lentisphaerae bacterium]|nr:oxidoreductase [Lentisphaerota bacterium]
MCGGAGKPEAKDIYRPEPATLARSEGLTAHERWFEVKLDSGRPLGHMPGQFVEISVPGIGEAPISVSSAPGRNGAFELVVRNVGNVTRALHGLPAGARIGVRGPFGTSFPVDGAMRGRDVLFICGGIGLVPVRSAIQYVLDHRPDYGAVTILFGTRSPSDRLFTDETAKWAGTRGVTYMETVDRGDAGWTGKVGVITTLMPDLKIDPARTVAVVCGPPIMYKFVIIELHKMKVADENIFVSLERNMKCGVGKCGHCQINGLYVCRKGPVFRYADVNDVREAV